MEYFVGVDVGGTFTDCAVMDEEGNVSIQGISDIASLVFNLGTTLKEDNLFKKAARTTVRVPDHRFGEGPA